MLVLNRRAGTPGGERTDPRRSGRSQDGGLGATVGPRDSILNIVPENAELIVEARLWPKDGGVGRRARLVAKKQSITAIARGMILYVSADRTQDKTSHFPYYAASIRLSAGALGEPGKLKLQAGMPTEVFIRTSERSAVECFIDPPTGFVRHALREP